MTVSSCSNDDEHALEAFEVVGGGDRQCRPRPAVTVAPVPTGVIVWAETWVWPWNSLTAPRTCTTSPRATELLLPLKTKMPSDVAASASCSASCSWT